MLLEIFEGDKDKIQVLQEFFGLCLTKITKYEKALFAIGEGANGKSTVLYVLQKLLGGSNFSAVPLEMFNNRHYLANLFCKLANISIETNAKSSVYDSTFKAVVSGDYIEADQKFKTPFKFRAFCKLIFALNNMPRVDDKTSAYFRRLIILRFNRQFEEYEQNKNLKYELVGEELDGIFIWCLAGLKRLKERSDFALSDGVKSEIKEYQKENNNVIIFVDERCELGIDKQVAKDELYKQYSEWCKSNGYQSLSKIKFGKEITKQYVSVKGIRDAESRFWSGIGIINLSYPVSYK